MDGWEKHKPLSVPRISIPDFVLLLGEILEGYSGRILHKRWCHWMSQETSVALCPPGW